MREKEKAVAEPAVVDKDADMMEMDEKEGEEEKRRKRRKSDVVNAVVDGGAAAMARGYD